jgi:hypothetical protein
VFWWYPEAIDLNGLPVWEDGRYGLFDADGDLLPAASAFGKPGDFNRDGVVDGADYVYWRKNSAAPQEYAEWRENFGETAGGTGQSVDGPASVPEPSAILLFAGLLCGTLCRRPRRGR